MSQRRITLDELAKLVGCTPQHLSDIRRGVRNPSDKLKLSIENATLELERADGVRRPKGVRAVDWFIPPADAPQGGTQGDAP